MNATLSVMLSALAAMVKILIVSLAGIVATKYPKDDPLLPSNALRYISRMSNIILLPCLIMGSLGVGIQPAFASRIYVLLAACITINLISYFLAYFAGKLYHLDGMDKALYLAIMVGIGSPNAVSLPIMVMQTLCEKDVVNADYGGDSDTCYNESVSMLFIYSIGWHLMFWSFGFPVLKSIKPIENGIAVTTTAADESKGKSITLEVRLRLALKWLKDVLVTPAMIGTILGIIIGFIGPLKSQLFEGVSVLEPLGSAIITLGSPVVCLNCLVMAASLANGTSSLKTKVAKPAGGSGSCSAPVAPRGKGDRQRQLTSSEVDSNHRNSNSSSSNNTSNHSLLSMASNSSLPGGKDGVGLYHYSANFSSNSNRQQHHHSQHLKANHYHSHHRVSDGKQYQQHQPQPMFSKLFARLPNRHSKLSHFVGSAAATSGSKSQSPSNDELALLSESSTHDGGGAGVGGRGSSHSPGLTSDSGHHITASSTTAAAAASSTTAAAADDDNKFTTAGLMGTMKIDKDAALTATGLESDCLKEQATSAGLRSQKLMNSLQQQHARIKREFELTTTTTTATLLRSSSTSDVSISSTTGGNNNNNNNNSKNNNSNSSYRGPLADEEMKSNGLPNGLFATKASAEGFIITHEDDDSTVNPLLSASMSSQELMVGADDDAVDWKNKSTARVAIAALEMDADENTRKEEEEKALPSWPAIGTFVLCRMLFAPAVIILVLLPIAVKAGIIPPEERMMRLVICIESASSSAQIVIVSLNQIGVPRIASMMAYMYAYQYAFGIFALTFWVTIAMSTIYQP